MPMMPGMLAMLLKSAKVLESLNHMWLAKEHFMIAQTPLFSRIILLQEMKPDVKKNPNNNPTDLRTHVQLWATTWWDPEPWSM